MKNYNVQEHYETTSPATPGSGKRKMYAKDTGFHEKTSEGTENKFCTIRPLPAGKQLHTGSITVVGSELQDSLGNVLTAYDGYLLTDV